MRRICTVALIIIIGSLLGRVSGQSIETIPDPLVTQDAPADVLSTQEIIPTIEIETLQPADTASPTENPTLTPLPSTTPQLSTAEATLDPMPSPSPDAVTVEVEATPNDSSSVVESTAWDLSVRELFEVAPQSPWLIPSAWGPDANQRLVASPISQDNQALSIPSIRYEAVLGDVQSQAAFFLSDGATASLALRVSENGAYTAELDSAGSVRLLRIDEIVAEGTISLLDTDSHILNVMAVGSTISVRVDDQIAAVYTDPSPLAHGAVELGGGVAAKGQLALDDVFIWLPQAASPALITSPTPIIPPSPTVEATVESVPAIAESGEVSAQAIQLLWNTPVQYSLSSNVQDIWNYTLPAGGNTSYYIEIERLSGDIELDLYVISASNATEHIAHAAPNGHVLIWLSHNTAGARSLRTIARDFVPGKSSTYRVTLHSCCKPLLTPDIEETYDKFVSAGHIFSYGGPGVSHWSYQLTTPTVHYLDWFRTEGNLAYSYSIRYRPTGAVVSHGTVLRDSGLPQTAMYVPSTVPGWYDVEFTRLKLLPPNHSTWTEGSYELGLFYGSPFPPAPTGFSVLERGVSTLSFKWNVDVTDKTQYFFLQRKPTLGANNYVTQDMLNADTLTATKTNLLCDTTYDYRLVAYNWASPSIDDGGPDAGDVEAEEMYSAPLLVTTLGCPPLNDQRNSAQALTTLPTSFEYGPNTDVYVSSALDDTGDPDLSCAPDGYSASIWYRYNSPTTPVILNVTTTGSTYDTVVGVYQNVNGQLVEKACHDDLVIFQNTSSQVIYETAPNQQYYILVSHWSEVLPETTAIAHVQFGLLHRPAAPTLLSPLNKGATRSELTWSDVPGAAEYHLQISATSTFANRLTDEYLPGIMVGTLSSSIADGSYFWRVRAVTSDGITGAWSPIWTFTKDTVAPPAPTITSPVANAVLTTLRPSFTASVPLAAGAIRYEWEIATDENFTALVPTVPSSTPTALLTLTQSLPQGQYYARVRACDAAGNCGAFSDPVRPFQIDLRLVPANNTPIQVTTTASAVAFKWALPQGVTAFTLQISTDATFDAEHAYTHDFTVPTPTAAPPLSWTIPNVGSELGHGTFYWRLVFTTPNLPSVTTPPRRFIVTPPLPIAPKFAVQPNAGILNTETLKLDWLEVAYSYLGISYGVTYEIQVDNLATFASPEYTSPAPISGLTHTTTPLADGIYFARVRAINEFGATGAWSLAQRVVMDATPPQPPTILTPYINALSSNSRQPLSWKAVPGATHYRVQYSRTPNFDNIWINESEIKAPAAPAVPAYTPKISLPQGQYFVRVAARDAALNWGEYSETAFTLAVNIAPIDNGNLLPTPATAATTRPYFRWTGVPGATQYQVVVASDAACTTEIARSPVLPATVLAWSYTADVDGTPLAPLDYGSYYWCVSVNRGAGTPATAAFYPNSLEMPPQGFRINITPTVPPAIAIIYPVTSLLVTSSQPTINWSEMPATVPNGPFKYEVQVDDDVRFNDREFEGITNFNELSISTSTLPDGKYNVRVRPINSAGGVGVWSLVRPFTIDTSEPATPTLLTPTQDSTFNGASPTITWTPVSDAVGYFVQISHSPNFSPRYEWQSKTTSTVVPFALLHQTYYVRVKAVDAAGNRSVLFSTRHAFNVQWPVTQAPIPVYYDTSENLAVLSWENLAWATRFEVQVSTNPTFTQIIASTEKTNFLMPQDATFDLPPRVDGIYYWRVRAGNNVQWFAWSDVITFAIDS